MPIGPNYEMERKLASDMQTGGREIFDQLFKNYAPALLGYISRLVDDQKAAEEALQKSFVEIWNNRSRFNPDIERLFTWMLKITKAITIGFIPKTRYQLNLQTQNLFAHDIVDERPANKDIANTTGTCILQDHLLELMHFNNYSIKEASVVLKIDENSVRSTLRSAISNLKTLK